MERKPNECALCAENVERVFDNGLECFAHVDTDRPGKLRMCAEPWRQDEHLSIGDDFVPRQVILKPEDNAKMAAMLSSVLAKPGGGDGTCGRCGYPARNQPLASIQKVKVLINDETRPIFECAERAQAEVAQWPDWKANQCRCTDEQLSKFMADIMRGKDVDDRLPCGCYAGRRHSKSNCREGLPSDPLPSCYSCKAPLDYEPSTQPALCGDCDNVP